MIEESVDDDLINSLRMTFLKMFQICYEVKCAVWHGIYLWKIALREIKIF